MTRSFKRIIWLPFICVFFLMTGLSYAADQAMIAAAKNDQDRLNDIYFYGSIKRIRSDG